MEKQQGFTIKGRNEYDLLFKVLKGELHPFNFHVELTDDGTRVEGDEVAKMLISKLIDRMGEKVLFSGKTDREALKPVISLVIQESLKHELTFRIQGLLHPLRPMSLCQVAFMQSLLSTDLDCVIGLGPACTGKTYLSVAAGLHLLAVNKVRQLVFTRPHVVMDGEVVTASVRNDLEYDDQFAQFEDILHDLVGHDEYSKLVEHKMLEIIPLGRMRGRTFNESYVLIDEAQNMTVRKMRMAINRVGRGSRLVINGDPDQADLIGDEPSGLAHLLGLIKDTDIAAIHRFETGRIVRNKTVANIEALYQRSGDGKAALVA